MNRFFAYTLASLCSFSGALQATQTCDWPMVNQGTDNTRSSACTTITFNDVKHGLVVQQWARPGDSVQAPAVVKDGIVYYGDSGSHFYAVDAVTGATLFNFDFPAGELVNGPAIVTSTRVYATTVSPNNLRLYAFDHTLTPVPGFNGGSAVEVDPGFTGVQANIFAGPVLVEGRVIVATTNSTPEETTTLNPTYRGGFQAFDADSGVELWRTAVSPVSSGYGTSGGAWSTAAVDTKLGLMFVGTTNATTPPASPLTDALLAIDYRTGVVKWSQQYTKDDVWSFQYACGGNFDVGSSPNLFSVGGNKQKDVVGCGSKAGVYRVFERKTGKPVWATPMIPKDAFPSIDGCPSAAVANDRVYTIANRDTSGISYNSFTVMAQYGLKAGNFEAIGQLLYYIQNTDQTYISSIDTKSGKVLWTNMRVAATLAAITHANGVLYTGNALGEIRGLNANTGEEYLIDNLNNTIGAPITVVGNQLFVGLGIGGPGGLFCYHKP